jgi:hypothetical protein
MIGKGAVFFLFYFPHFIFESFYLFCFFFLTAISHLMLFIRENIAISG